MFKSYPIEYGSLNTYKTSKGIEAQESTQASNLLLDKIVGEIKAIGPFTKQVFATSVTSCFLYNNYFFVQCGINVYINGVLSLTLNSSERLSYVAAISNTGETYLLLNNIGGSYKYVGGVFSGLGTDAPSNPPIGKNALLNFDLIYSSYNGYPIASSHFWAQQYSGYERQEYCVDTMTMGYYLQYVGGVYYAITAMMLLYAHNPNGEKVQLAPCGEGTFTNDPPVVYDIFSEFLSSWPAAATDDIGSNHYMPVRTSQTREHSDGNSRTSLYASPYGLIQIPDGDNVKLKFYIKALHRNTGALKLILSTDKIAYSPTATEYDRLDCIIQSFDIAALTQNVNTLVEVTLNTSATDFWGKGYENLLFVTIVEPNVYMGGVLDAKYEVTKFGIYDADHYGTLDTESAFYIYTYYNSVTTTESAASPAPTYNGMKAIDNKVGVYVEASTDSQIDQIKIYRLDNTTSGEFLLVDTISNTTQTYWDDIDSGSLGAAFAGEVSEPPTPGLKQMLYHKNRVFGVKDNILYNSEKNDPEAWGDGASNRTQIGDQYEILTCNSIGNMIVLTKKDTPFIYTVDVSGNAPFEVQQFPIESTPVGRLAVTTSGGVIYLASDGLYKFNGFSSENITIKVRDKFKGEPSIIFKAAEKIYCLNPSIVLDLTTGIITEFDMNGVTIFYNANGNLVIGFNNGDIYTLDENLGNLFPFQLVYKSKDFLFDEPAEYKSIRRCDIEVKCKTIIEAYGEGTITGTLIIDFGGYIFEVSEEILNYVRFEIDHDILTSTDIRVYPKDAAFSATNYNLTIIINGVTWDDDYYDEITGDFSYDFGTISFPLGGDLNSYFLYNNNLAIDAQMEFSNEKGLIYTKELIQGVNDFSLPAIYKGRELNFKLKARQGITFKTPNVLKVVSKGGQ